MPHEPSPYVTYEWHSQCWKTTLTPAGRKFMRQHYPDSRDEDLIPQLGVPIGRRTYIRLARRLKLRKSAAHMAAMRHKAMKQAYAINLAFGLFEERSRQLKGRRIPGAEKHQFKPGETHADRYGEERAREIYAKTAATHRSLIRRERLRVLSGEPQQTHLRVMRHEAASSARYRLLRIHHYRPADPEESVPTSFTWDADTTRRPRLEERYARRHDFRFLPPEAWWETVAAAEEDDDDSLITIQEMDDDLE